MKKFEAHRYPLPGDTPTRWQEPHEGCRVVAVLQDSGSLFVVYEVPVEYEPVRNWWREAAVAAG